MAAARRPRGAHQGHGPTRGADIARAAQWVRAPHAQVIERYRRQGCSIMTRPWRAHCGWVRESWWGGGERGSAVLARSGMNICWMSGVQALVLWRGTIERRPRGRFAPHRFDEPAFPDLRQMSPRVRMVEWRPFSGDALLCGNWSSPAAG
jgi:hypothetical protein